MPGYAMSGGVRMVPHPSRTPATAARGTACSLVQSGALDPHPDFDARSSLCPPSLLTHLPAVRCSSMSVEGMASLSWLMARGKAVWCRVRLVVAVNWKWACQGHHRPGGETSVLSD